jgi:agmatinase
MSINNFGHLEEPFNDYNKSKVVILPVPYDVTRKWIIGWKTNTANGPSAIITASCNMELYDEELNKTTAELGIHTSEKLKPKNTPESMHESIYKKSQELIKDNKFIVMLGGEHSITSGLVKAYKEKYNNLSVLQLDAHTDLREKYEGTKYSHASVMKRIIDMNVKTVQVGIRSQDEDEIQTIKENNLPIFYARDIVNNDDWHDKAINELTDNVFITIDLDVFDPSIIPATGTPEPGGLGWYTVIKFLKKVAEEKNIVGFDVVELSPIKGLHHADFTAAKLIYKLIGYVFNG